MGLKPLDRMILILLEPKMSLTSQLLSGIITFEFIHRFNGNMTTDERLGSCLDPFDCLERDSAEPKSTIRVSKKPFALQISP